MKKGILYLVSTGPGGTLYLTGDAVYALHKSTVIVGYPKYLKEIEHFTKGKETITSGMRKEVQRVGAAVEKAKEGNVVSLVSNGDINVYGMASLALEIIEKRSYQDDIEVESIPGVTSFLGAASKAGAPVSSDFAIVSLSNIFTSDDVIRKRLENAMKGDFVIGIYNPISRVRKEPYHIFLDYLGKYLKPETPIIIATNVGRETESITVVDVKKLIEIGEDETLINMSTILIVGNSLTKVNDRNQVITPRGYASIE